MDDPADDAGAANAALGHEATAQGEALAKPSLAAPDLALSVRNLGVCFGTAQEPAEVVKGVDFDLQRGETLAIVGESGSGKTLACRSLMGLLPPSARISRGGALFHAEPGDAPVDLLALSPTEQRRIRGNRLAMIFQEPMSSLSPFHQIGAQVTEALELHRRERGSAARALVMETLEQVGFPSPQRAYDAYSFELSGGLRQRAMIAMAMICRPTILIADEPTTALDVSTQALILDLIEQLRAEHGMSVLFITHDLGVVANAAHRVTVMRRGRVMEAGPVGDVLADPRHGYTRKLIDAAPRIEFADAPAAGARDMSDLILEIQDVRKTYVSRKGPIWAPKQLIPALNGVDLRLPRGRTVALVGESGSGKSTVAKIAMRAETPDPGGRVFFDFGDGAGAVDAARLTGEDLMRFRRDVQMVFQDPFASLSPRMTIQDILTEPLRIHTGATDARTAADRRDHAAALLRRVGMPVDSLGRYPHAFSGGQRQRICIARALALSPTLLICDEPTSALDVSVQAQVLDLLEGLKADMGLSYLFISHDLAVVARLADEIAVMCRGVVVEQAPTARLFASPAHPYTQALMAAAPEPDTEKKLDLAKIAAGAGAEPEHWPAPFGYRRDDPPPIVEIAEGHLVRRAAQIAAV